MARRRLTPLTGLIVGILFGGVIGTYLTRYFGFLVVLGAILGLLVGQWSQNQQKPDVVWLDRK
jgi:hypothetical protein